MTKRKTKITAVNPPSDDELIGKAREALDTAVALLLEVSGPRKDAAHYVAGRVQIRMDQLKGE